VWKRQENEFSGLACSFEESELHKLYSSTIARLESSMGNQDYVRKLP